MLVSVNLDPQTLNPYSRYPHIGTPNFGNPPNVGALVWSLGVQVLKAWGFGLGSACSFKSLRFRVRLEDLGLGFRV